MPSSSSNNTGGSTSSLAALRAELQAHEAEQAAYEADERRKREAELREGRLFRPRSSPSRQKKDRARTPTPPPAPAADASDDAVNVTAEQEAAWAFLEEERFRWAVSPTPLSRESPSQTRGASSTAITSGVPTPLIEPAVVAGVKTRPPVSTTPTVVPDPPPATTTAHHSAAALEDAAEEAWANRAAALQLLRRNCASQRRAAEFDLDEAMFAGPQAESSDDSDGFDADVEVDWREMTSTLYGLCRRFEATQYCGEAEATELAHFLQDHAEYEWNTAEQQMIWGAVRHCYRHAEPLHNKEWLRQICELIDSGNFHFAPSVALTSHLLYAAVHVQHLPTRTRDKIRRWALRSTLLVRRRLVVLRELGVAQPTWSDVNASVSGLSRAVPVPTYTLPDAVSRQLGDPDGELLRGVPNHATDGTLGGNDAQQRPPSSPSNRKEE